MKKLFLQFVAAGTLSAQSVGGPLLGYVVDGEARLRPMYGMASAAHVGSAVREGVRDSWGTLALLADGTAVRNGVTLEGVWDSVQAGAFLDATGREVLVAVGSPWRLALPERAVAVSVSASGERVVTVLADESVAVWSSGGKAEFRVAASKWWSVAFAGERALAYDPAANALLWLDGVEGVAVLRKLEGAGGRYALAVDQAGKQAILLGEKLLLAPLAGGEVRALTPPEGATRLEMMGGGRTFLLTRDPGRPLWVLDPEGAESLLVIPALTGEAGGRQ